LVGKPEGKRPLVRPRCKWEDNIKMHLKEMGFELWIGLIWLRIRIVAGFCKHGKEPPGSIEDGEFLDS
jgi:hypothetical protein